MKELTTQELFDIEGGKDIRLSDVLFCAAGVVLCFVPGWQALGVAICALALLY